MNYKLRKWIRIGLLITLTSMIAGVLVFTPVLSQAIDVFTNVDQRPVVSTDQEADTQAPLTDHPEGRLVNAIVADALGQSSNADPLAAVQSDEPDQETPVMSNAQGEGASLPEEGEGILAADMQAESGHINAVDSVYVLPGADFRSDGFDPDGYFFSFWGGYLAGKADASVDTCLMAPVNLPTGVTMVDMYAKVIDNSPTLYIWPSLFRLDNYTGDVLELAKMHTTPTFADPGLVTIYYTSITNPDVSYPSYSYYVGGCIPGATIKLYSIRIYYH